MTEEKMYSIQYFCEHGINASFAGNQAIVNTLLKIMEKPFGKRGTFKFATGPDIVRRKMLVIDMDRVISLEIGPVDAGNA